jgi:hypothetical protein
MEFLPIPPAESPVEMLVCPTAQAGNLKHDFSRAGFYGSPMWRDKETTGDVLEIAGANAKIPIRPKPSFEYFAVVPWSHQVTYRCIAFFTPEEMRSQNLAQVDQGVPGGVYRL